MQSININEAIDQSTYLIQRKDEIYFFFIKTFSDKSNVKCYLKRQSLFENIILIKYELTVKNDEISPINLLIYFYNDFPYDEPDFYLENNSQFEINNNYLDSIISRKNLRINSKVFYIWDYSKKNINDFFTKIQKVFELTFPFIKSDVPNNFSGNCDLKIDECIPIIFNNNLSHSLYQSMIYESSSNEIFSDLFNLSKKLEKQKNNYSRNEEIEVKVKNIIRKEIRNKCEKVIPNIIEHLKLKRNKFEEIEKTILNENIINNKNNLVKKFENTISKLNILKDKFKIQEKKLIEINNNLKKEKNKINLNNLQNYFTVENEDILNFMSMEKDDLEYLFNIKIFFAKKIISFEYTKNLIRNISKEIFRIKFLINKDLLNI